MNNINFAIIKKFVIGERLRFEVAGQGFNLLNHPQFVPGFVDSVNSVVTAYTPGVHSFVTAGNAPFGGDDAAFSSNPRLVQVVLKLAW